MEKIKYWKEIDGLEAGFSMRAKREEPRENLAAVGFLVVRPVQVHGDRIGSVTEEQKELCLKQGKKELVFPDTDAVITACRGVALTTVHADCLPVWLYDEERGAVGLAHAGWRGTLAGIGEKTAAAMEETLCTSRKTMRAIVGPGIGPCCFEVGPEVLQAFLERFDFMDGCYRKGEEDRYFLDLKEINRRQLDAFGINSVEVSPLCTVCSVSKETGNPLFYSYRRENGTRERMTAWIALMP